MTLIDLSSTPLPPAAEEMLARASAGASGPKPWRLRMEREARDLLALAVRAPRMAVLDLQMPGDLRAVVQLRMPVPCRENDGDLVLAPGAILGLSYPRICMTQALPGAAFVQVLQPSGVYLPSVKEHPQLVCLGARIPPGTALQELVMMAFRAVVLQEVNLDRQDPAGMFRPDAAAWWQANSDRIPLTHAPFLAEDDADPGRPE